VLPVLKKGKDVMILSVGALCDTPFFEEIEKVAKEKGCKVRIPSGAIAGIDGVKSASIREIYSVRLTTRKPPSGFKGNAYVKEKGVDLGSLKKEVTFFCGDVVEAVKYFPENVNVAASLSIAGIGATRTEVKVMADPSVEENIHEIEVEGEFGKMLVRVENVPSPLNPKTSFLAALSAIGTLKDIASSIKVGT
jgi:aspartate dehydrogenase